MSGETLAAIVTAYVLFAIPAFLLGRYLFRWGKWRYGYTSQAVIYTIVGLVFWPLTLLVIALRGFPRLPQA